MVLFLNYLILAFLKDSIYPIKKVHSFPSLLGIFSMKGVQFCQMPSSVEILLLYSVNVLSYVY